jgi:hypothetical protein
MARTLIGRCKTCGKSPQAIVVNQKDLLALAAIVDDVEQSYEGDSGPRARAARADAKRVRAIINRAQRARPKGPR